LASDINRIALAGRLDAPGTEAAELRFTAAVAGTNRHALVDFADVCFVGSLGIRLLLSVARVLQRRGWRMVLFGVAGQAREVFDTVALAEVIPIAADEAEARRLLAA